ncbi:Fc receptor-like protein 2 [Sardina pilchardus]|uniref:Fc receptor-like protein 2 n=1 Tax=Sardina pilchardus TaxID=27697 RepID=UPI002E157F93
MYSEQAPPTARVVVVSPQPPFFSGERVTLWCNIVEYTDWGQYFWYRDNRLLPSQTSETITITLPQEAGQYQCSGQRKDRPHVSSRKRGKRRSVFTRKVTLRCDMGQSAGWTFYWYRNTQTSDPVAQTDGDSYSISSVKVSDGGQYWCRAGRGDPVYYTQYSNEVWVKITESPKAVATLLPNWPDFFRGETITFRCDIQGDQHGHWQYSWYKIGNVAPNPLHTRKKFTISYAEESDSGEYSCRGTRSRDPQTSETSASVRITVSGRSPPSSLVVHPDTNQHFDLKSLSLSCEGIVTLTGWRLRWFPGWSKHKMCPNGWAEARSTCRGDKAFSSESGVYWCQSETGERSNPVNISVHDGSMILESPAHPVTEGDPLTLRCRYRYQPSNISADFYKDGTLLQTSTTGEMTIPAVSKSHEGLYKCRNPESGESPKSWITVKVSGNASYKLSVFFYIVFYFVLCQLYL